MFPACLVSMVFVVQNAAPMAHNPPPLLMLMMLARRAPKSTPEAIKSSLRSENPDGQ